MIMICFILWIPLSSAAAVEVAAGKVGRRVSVGTPSVAVEIVGFGLAVGEGLTGPGVPGREIETGKLQLARMERSASKITIFFFIGVLFVVPLFY